MNALIERLKIRLWRDEGQDLLEYALLVALISLAAIGAVTTVGQTVSGSSIIFCQVSNRWPQVLQRYSYVGIAALHLPN